jgi:hypothetical protein
VERVRVSKGNGAWGIVKLQVSHCVWPSAFVLALGTLLFHNHTGPIYVCLFWD